MLEFTLKELREQAKKENIKGYSTLKKEELLELLIKKNNDNLNSPPPSLDNLISDIKNNDNSIQLINIFENDPNIENITLENGKTFKINKLTDSIKEGFLEILPDGYGFLRNASMQSSKDDIYISEKFINEYNAKTGDLVKCIIRKNANPNKYPGVVYVISVNKQNSAVKIESSDNTNNSNFSKLTPIFPNEKLKLETESTEYLGRIMDIFSPIGKGQRSLIVSPPKAGKTTVLKNIANAIKMNNPNVELYMLLIDERPEEVTDMQESVNGTIVYSTFDKHPSNHIKVAEDLIETAKLLTESGKDVVILLDSITRLARAYNLIIPSTGKVLSGGFDPGALYKPKQLFGSARNTKEAGSLTIIATALVDTGSKMDDLIYEELKGTGNMELILNRDLAENRIFPAIDVKSSGTRRNDLILTPSEETLEIYLRQNLSDKNSKETLEQILLLFKNYNSNEKLIEDILKKVFNK